MKFGIIYSADAKEIGPAHRPPEDQLFDHTPGKYNFHGVEITMEQPPSEGHIWKRTEDDESELFSNWEHEKWCACLNLEQFQDFLSHTCIEFQDVETMGSLGAPMPDGDVCLAILPAVYFINYDEDCELYAYVTPYIEPDDALLVPGLDTTKDEFDEADFQLIKSWMKENF